MFLCHLTPPYLKALLYHLPLLILELQQGRKGFYFISRNKFPTSVFAHNSLSNLSNILPTWLEFPLLKQGGKQAAVSSTPYIQQLAFI